MGPIKGDTRSLDNGSHALSLLQLEAENEAYSRAHHVKRLGFLKLHSTSCLLRQGAGAGPTPPLGRDSLADAALHAEGCGVHMFQPWGFRKAGWRLLRLGLVGSSQVSG